MKTLAFAWRYLWSRPLGAALNVLLLSLGLASITFLLLVAHSRKTTVVLGAAVKWIIVI